MSGTPWWRSAVVYQIYPRSFADADGDGVGDLEGIRRHLDHVRELGADAIWLSPVYRSPMAGAGYDISEHCDKDPMFGTLADMDALIAEAHAHHLHLVLDTSDQHPWFAESRWSRLSAKRDWYIWRDEPNNWRRAVDGGSAWTWDEETGQCYLHLFLPQQPDLNWRNPEVVEAMHGVLRFWLDRGVDGFRIDVAHCTGKDPDFAGHPRCAAGEALIAVNDQPHSHEVMLVRRLARRGGSARTLVVRRRQIDLTDQSGRHVVTRRRLQPHPADGPLGQPCVIFSPQWRRPARSPDLAGATQR
ncbi:Alpha amylase, catalytic domain [Promicromonospora umidemergens]|nr:Alpha amylase, catalytic domain [Promicromonospora umidemergens]